MEKSVKRTLGAIAAVLGSLVLVAAGVAIADTDAIRSTFGLQRETETTSMQVVNAVERTEEVSLVSLSIQGIEKRSESASTFFGIVVPGSDRTKFLMYSFDAKLGLDARDVSISQTGENEFTVAISDFSFIGYDNVKFEIATESNGALSWVTPEIDAAAMASSILDDTATHRQLTKHQDLLQDQAKAFYGGIIGAVDPTIEVKFTFGSN